MKRITLLVLVLALCFALPVFAQDEESMEGAPEMAMAPPPPLDNEFLKSFVGDWEGKSEGTMGVSEEKINYQMGLDGQFLLVQVNSKSEMGSFTGMGAVTLDKEGKVKGYWIDSWRAMAEGSGTIEGNKITMTWTMDEGTYTRTEEMVDENTIMTTGKMEMADGSVMEDKGKFTRVKAMTEKN